ncbi:MAG: VOC family protein [Pseudomonadota bacterium]
MAQHLTLVTLVVPDYDAGIAFYRDAVGFTVVEDLPLGGGKRWVVLRPPGAQEGGVLLARAVDAAQTAAIGNQTGGRVAFFLQTDDFARDHAAMLAAGVTFLEAPRVEPYGTVAVWRDIFGNTWDLLQRA